MGTRSRDRPYRGCHQSCPRCCFGLGGNARRSTRGRVLVVDRRRLWRRRPRCTMFFCSSLEGRRSLRGIDRHRWRRSRRRDLALATDLAPGSLPLLPRPSSCTPPPVVSSSVDGKSASASLSSSLRRSSDEPSSIPRRALDPVARLRFPM